MRRSSLLNFLLTFGLALLGASGDAAAQLSGRHDKLALSSETDPFGTTYGTIDGTMLLNSGLTTFYKTGFFSSPKIYQGTTAKVDRGLASSTAAPDGATFGGFIAYDVNALGKIAFEGFANSGYSLYLASTTGITVVALKGAAAPGGGVLNTFSDFISVNDSGKVAFQAYTTGGPGSGIFLQTGSGIVSLAVLAANAPGGGTFSNVGSVVALNNAGQVAFTGSTTGGGAGNGVFLATESTSNLISSRATNDLSLNNSGQVAFAADSAIYLATTSGETAIVSSGDNAPGGGTFSSFANVVLNHAGQVAFRAQTTGGPGEGLYLWTTNGVKSIVLKNAAAPGGGVFTALGAPVLNNAGQVVFSASTGGGDLIGLGDGTDLFKVIGAGDSLLGVTITNLSLDVPGKVAGHGPVNDVGQVAYRADFSNGVTGIFVFTPGLHWRTAGAGNWDTAANWTSNILPGPANDVAIDPGSAAVVTGPAANTTVRSLLVGGGAGASTLKLQTGVMLTASSGTSIATNGTLAGAGTIGGDLTLLAGTHVALQIGGPVRGTDYDFLKVTGRAVLTGTLDVTLKNGAILHGGDAFDLLDLGTRSGNFVTVNLPPLVAGLTWDKSKLYTTGTISVSMATFFAASQGKYSGLVTANPTAVASSGSLALKLDQGGGFSGTLKIGGKSIPVHGALDDSGFFSGVLGKTGFTLDLQLDLLNGTDQFTATIKQGATTFSAAKIDRIQTGFTTKNPVPLAGSYTVALPPDPSHPEATYPHGAGYGVLVVAPAGTVKLTGVLGDQTTASPAGILSKNNEFSVFLPLYGGKGFLSGVLTLRDASMANHVEGTLHWSKPLNSAKLYPAAFSGDIVVLGSHYTAPPSLAVGAATFSITDGNITMTPAKNLTVAAGDLVSITTAEKFSLKFTAKTGIFGGTFLDADLKSRTYKGAFLQKQNVGKGVFKGELQTGKIELQPQ